ncbi:ATP-binding cassette domain-containing protein [Streptomyces sp. NPDC046984]|uniref:ABC transporter ATP-binding protein n=1 Tax=Streptomyces sp. NPDC046984 TaxID=3155138 RepID=UPI0033DDFEF1
MSAPVARTPAVQPAAPASDPDPVVVIDDLHIVYRSRTPRPGGGCAAGALRELLARRRRPVAREVHAVRGISLVVREGESIGVIGANGSGKSSLLRAIAGTLPPQRGRVYTRGHPALLGVNPGLMSDLSGERNIVLGCLAMGMSGQQVREKFNEVVELANLGDALDRPLGTYSTGMMQRLRFAITTAVPHDVLLIDEALATGDAVFRRRSAERMAELRDQAATVFLVSHSLSTIQDGCNRAIWVEDGRVRMIGNPAEVLAHYRGSPEHSGRSLRPGGDAP